MGLPREISMPGWGSGCLLPAAGIGVACHDSLIMSPLELRRKCPLPPGWTFASHRRPWRSVGAKRHLTGRGGGVMARLLGQGAPNFLPAPKALARSNTRFAPRMVFSRLG